MRYERTGSNEWVAYSKRGTVSRMPSDCALEILRRSKVTLMHDVEFGLVTDQGVSFVASDFRFVDSEETDGD